jgi:hypothetical protein
MESLKPGPVKSDALLEPETSTATSSQAIFVEGSTGGLRWLFGILDNLSLTAMTEPTTKGQPYPPGHLIEALKLADKYDIIFLPRLLTEVLWSLARRNCYDALTSYRLAYEMGNVCLAVYAVKQMKGLPTPPSFPLKLAQSLGLEAWWALVSAYHSTDWVLHDGYGGGRVRWTSSPENWREVAKALKVPVATRNSCSALQTVAPRRTSDMCMYACLQPECTPTESENLADTVRLMRATGLLR